MKREVNLSFTRSTPLKKIRVVQGDTGRQLIVKLNDEDTTTLVQSTARIYCQKPDGTEVYNDCQIIDKEIFVSLTSQMLAVVGNVLAQIQITNQFGYVTSYLFILVVEPSLVTESSIESSNEWGALQTALGSVDKINALYENAYAQGTVVDSITSMTDTSKTYILRTDGQIYYYNGSAWTVMSRGGNVDDYSYVTMLDTTLTEEVAQIDIDKVEGRTFNCKEFYVQLDVPVTSTATKISCNIKRTNSTYQMLSTELATLKTTTDSTKHTLAVFDYTQLGSFAFKCMYGGQIPALNTGWTNSYPNVPMASNSRPLVNVDALGTTGIRISGLFPSGTTIKVYGKCKLGEAPSVRSEIETTKDEKLFYNTTNYYYGMKSTDEWAILGFYTRAGTSKSAILIGETETSVNAYKDNNPSASAMSGNPSGTITYDGKTYYYNTSYGMTSLVGTGYEVDSSITNIKTVVSTILDYYFNK